MIGLQDVFQNVIRAALCNQRARRLLSKQLRKVLTPQLQVPQKPPRPQTPVIMVPPSKYHADLATVFESQFYHDVVFIVEGRQIKAHKAILAAAGCEMATIFSINSHDLEKECFNSLESSHVSDDSQTLTVITADPSLTFEVLNSLLHFLYSGSISSNASLDQLLEAAKFLNTTIVTNIVSNQHDTKSIFTTWKSTVAGNMQKLQFEGELADIWFDLEDNVIPAHKAILVSRCQMMAAMFQEGHFKEANRQIVSEVILERTLVAHKGSINSDFH